MEVIQIPVWSDNYAYLICEGGKAAVVDSPEAGPIEKALEAKHLELAAIWNTHHHADHVGSNKNLIAAHPGLAVTGSSQDAGRIPGITRELNEGDHVQLDGLDAEVFFVPGHTSGHIAYYLKDHNVLFCGDTLFAGGCGRLFEGTPAQMVDSLSKLRVLPDETRVYCAHEYTLSNLKFAVTVEPGNAALKERFEKVQAMREQGESTVPSTIGEEKATNPFMRWDAPEIIETARSQGGASSDDPAEVFGAIRRMKDSF